MSRYEIRIPLNRKGIGRSYPAWLEWFRIMPYRFRRAHRWWAQSAGFFWMPCPLCDQPFGGHEWREIDGKPSSIPDPLNPPPSDQTGPLISLGMRVGICPRCTAAGRGVPERWNLDA